VQQPELADTAPLPVGPQRVELFGRWRRVAFEHRHSVSLACEQGAE
jgi:hypothetical protein